MPPKKMSDRGSGRRRMLLLRIFPQKFSAQERVERCMDAFHELHDGEGPSSTPEEMMRKVQLFISEADSILADGEEEKDGLAQTLSKHPWFVQSLLEVRYDPGKNTLALAAVGGVEDWDAMEEETLREWNEEKEEKEEKPEEEYQEVKDEEEAAWARAAAGGAPGGRWATPAAEEWPSDQGGQGAWGQPRAQDRSRSPLRSSRTGAATDGRVDWDHVASMKGSQLGTSAKAKATAVVSKSAAIAAGYMAMIEAPAKAAPLGAAVSKAAVFGKPPPPPREADAPPEGLEDPEQRRFAEALMRCLPEDIRPRRVRGGVQGVMTACLSARGDTWPKLDLVGGGTGGSSSIADLHELSVALLSRVKEKALAGAVPVDEGTELTTMFVKENKLGPDAEASLRKLNTTANLRVIGAGSVTGCDPQAVIMARIRRARDAGSVSAHLLQLSPRELATFIEENWVSTEAERALRLCSAEVQRQVVAEGPLLGQTPSAEMAERIDQAQVKMLSAAAA